MEQKVGICLQFSNPNQSADPPPSTILFSFRRYTLPLHSHTNQRHRLLPTRTFHFLHRHHRYQHHHDSCVSQTATPTTEAKPTPTITRDANVNPGIQKLRVTRNHTTTIVIRHTVYHSCHFIFPHFSLLPFCSVRRVLPILQPNAFVKR